MALGSRQSCCGQARPTRRPIASPSSIRHSNRTAEPLEAGIFSHTVPPDRLSFQARLGARGRGCLLHDLRGCGGREGAMDFDGRARSQSAHEYRGRVVRLSSKGSLV